MQVVQHFLVPFPPSFRIIDFRIIPVLGHINLSDLKVAHCEKFINHLIEDKLSERYIEYIYAVLYGALEKAVDWELILRNPLRKVDIPRGRRKYITWTREELNKFLQYAEFGDIIYYYVFLTDTYTGLRRGELLGLKWSDIDFNEESINVERTLIYDNQGFRFGPLKTDSSQRSIKIDNFLLSELKKYRKKQMEFKLMLGKAYKDENLVFARHNGKPIYPRTLTTILTEL